MDYTHLGRSGLTVSRICLGTMNFGSLTPAGDAYAIMDRAHELGINFFDVEDYLFETFTDASPQVRHTKGPPVSEGGR